MSNYAKIWTDIVNDSWFVSLSGLGRSVWIQLIIDAKIGGDTGMVSGRSTDALGTRWGMDGDTVGKFLGNFAEDKKISLSYPHKHCIEINILNYHYHQSVRRPDDKTSKHGIDSQNKGKIPENSLTNKIIPDNTKPDKNIMSGKPDDSLAFEKKVIEWKTKQVHAWYCEVMERDPNQYKLSDARKKKIMSRLQEFKISELWAAITALSWSDWHMGENPKGEKYNDLIENLFKSYEQTDKWLQKYIDTQGDGKEIEEIERNINRTIESKRAGKAEVPKSVQGQPPTDPGTPGVVADSETSTAPSTL
jgi:hypothetical protein